MRKERQKPPEGFVDDGNRVPDGGKHARIGLGRRELGQSCRSGGLRAIRGDLFHVLDGGDQVILDAQPPETPPAGAFAIAHMSRSRFDGGDHTATITSGSTDWLPL